MCACVCVRGCCYVRGCSTGPARACHLVSGHTLSLTVRGRYFRSVVLQGDVYIICVF